jgi:hypothetical protein
MEALIEHIYLVGIVMVCALVISVAILIDSKRKVK